MSSAGKVTKIRCVASAITLAIAMLGFMGSDARAQSRSLERSVKVDIAPQKVSTALLQFSHQAEIQVLMPGLVADRQDTKGVRGKMSVEEAITRLLEGTTLRFHIVGENVIGIESDPSASNASSGDSIRLSRSDARLISQPGVANDTGTSPRAREDEGAAEGLQEILVTAQKRTERLVDAPQSVTVLSGDELTRMGAAQFRDFAGTIPGLAFTTAGAGYTQINLRGVTAGTDLSPTVAIYLDDVPYGSSSTFTVAGPLTLDAGLFDLDRIEVLRGPQGTLYGAAAIGGLIKYVSTRPDTETFGGNARTGVATTQHGGVSFNAGAAVNIPIVTGKSALRVSGFEFRDGGYIDNLALDRKDVNRSDIYGGRVDVLLTPTEALSVRITGYAQDIARDGLGTANYTLAGVPITSSLEHSRPYAEPFDQRYRLMSATVSYDLGTAALTSISSYQTARTGLRLDASALYVPLFATPAFGSRSYGAVGTFAEVSVNKFAQEIRLASSGAAALEWLVGGFYTRETAEQAQVLDPRDLAGRPATNDLFTYSNPSRYQDLAAFGDITYHFTRKFDMTGGVRYARNEQTTTQIASGLLGQSRPKRSATDSVLTYLANARYHFSDRTTGYLRFATGYRPGGPNIVLNDPVTGQPMAPPTFDADTLRSYEAGIKTETAGRTLGVDLAAYYIDWRDILITARRNGISVRTNAPGGAAVEGAELALTFRLIDRIVVTGAFAYMDAHLSNAFPDLGGVEGEQLPNVPDVMGSLSADFVLSPSPLRPVVGATVRYVSDRKQQLGPAGYRLPEYTTVDVRTGAVLGPLDLQLYVHNLLDERGQLSESALGFAQVAIQQPRTIGLTATMRF